MDTTTLISAATTLDAHGEALVSRAHALARQSDAMRWDSPAARRCRTVLDALCAHLLATGNSSAALADSIRSCAARVARPR